MRVERDYCDFVLLHREIKNQRETAINKFISCSKCCMHYKYSMSAYKKRTPAAVLRAILGIKDHEWADLLGCSPFTIHSLECGRLKISDEMAHRMSIESGISPDWLLAGDARAKPVSLYDQPYTKTL